MEKSDLAVGKTYRGKRFRETAFGIGNNDRTILWIGENTLQYDSGTVKTGSKYPRVTIDKFLKWVKEDVSHLYEGK